MRTSLAVLGLLLVACSQGGTADQVLATATIGTGGGVIEVTEGDFAGLRLTVPADALARPATLRVVQPAPPPPTGGYEPQVVRAPMPGGPFRIDPPDVEFVVPALLRVPYSVAAMRTRTGLGNVQLRHTSLLGESRRDPQTVDVDAGRFEVPITILGSFQADFGPVTTSLSDYFGPEGTVQLEDGVSFARQRADEPRLMARLIDRWLVDDGSGARGVYFENFAQVGRVSTADDWQELWQTPAYLRFEPYTAVPPPPQTTATQVYAPIAAASPVHPGTASSVAWFGFTEPITIAGRRFLDVMRLQMYTSWERPDIGSGSDHVAYWFSPGAGLLQLQWNGVVHQRTDL